MFKYAIVVCQWCGGRFYSNLQGRHLYINRLIDWFRPAPLVTPHPCSVDLSQLWLDLGGEG